MKDLLKDRLVKGLEAGHRLVMITMDEADILRLIDLIDREELPAEKRDFEIGYKAGFELGRQRAIADVIKCVKEMRTYGGDSQKRADEVPDHPAGRPADMQ